MLESSQASPEFPPVHDFVKKGLNKTLSEKEAFRVSRWVSVIIGVISLGIALRPPALVLVLTAFSWAVIASTCLWPILAGIYWKGATRWGVLTSMIGGAAVALIWTAMGAPFDIHGFLPGIGIGLILLILISRFTPKPSLSHLSRIWKG